MRRWIFAFALLLAAAPSALADKHRGRGHGKHHYYAPQRHYVEYRAPVVYRHWAPAYGVVPGYYRARFRPVPPQYYEAYGPVPYGCRRAFVDGYLVDYRPSNFLVINFTRVW